MASQSAISGMCRNLSLFRTKAPTLCGMNVRAHGEHCIWQCFTYKLQLAIHVVGWCILRFENLSYSCPYSMCFLELLPDCSILLFVLGEYFDLKETACCSTLSCTYKSCLSAMPLPAPSGSFLLCMSSKPMICYLCFHDNCYVYSHLALPPCCGPQSFSSINDDPRCHSKGPATPWLRGCQWSVLDHCHAAMCVCVC